jgi:hypothetical protein
MRSLALHLPTSPASDNTVTIGILLIAVGLAIAIAAISICRRRPQ